MEDDTMKKIFYTIGIIGMIIIDILTFIIPKNPYYIIPAITIYSFDKPLWLCIIMSCNFIFLGALYEIYDLTKK